MLQLVVSHKPPNGLGAVAVATSAKGREIKTPAPGPRDSTGHPMARRHPGVRKLWN